ncbi:MAG: TMEM43 family protein [Ardenticatenaceae bacterium]|nr:TMEM43 family protein [Ardenticatenaceae bacterium]MCB9444655.1 TMEM43 family protein [Ardenticatenaceae bacterium]
MMRRRRESKNPFVRMLFGVLVLLGSVVLLWTNEGRINLADVAVKSKPVGAEVVDAANEGEFVSVTGRLDTAVPVTDGLYLRRAEFIQVRRWVEMYAWVEKEESDEDNTYYKYELEWTNDPRSAEEFSEPAGHENPLMPVYGETFTAVSATLGAFQIDTQQMDLPRPESLALSSQNVLEGPYRISEKYLFEGKGSLDAPQLGDVRVSFTAVPAGITATALGVQTGSGFTPYDYRGRAKLYRVLSGNQSDAIQQLETEYKIALWGFRAIGFLAMWLGLGLLASPLTALLRFIPVLGNLGRKAISALTFVLALVLSLVIIVVSALLHNIWAMLIILILLGAGFYWWQRNQQPVTSN